MRLTVFCKKLDLQFIAHEIVVGSYTLPSPHVQLASTRCHSCDRCSQILPIFHALLLPCIILTCSCGYQQLSYGHKHFHETYFWSHQQAFPHLQLMNGTWSWGRPGNECMCFWMQFGSHCLRSGEIPLQTVDIHAPDVNYRQYLSSNLRIHTALNVDIKTIVWKILGYL